MYRSPYGTSIPTWLSAPGSVLMKRLVTGSKYEAQVVRVDLLEANPDYSHVRLPDGRETTVSNRHLAPMGDVPEQDDTQAPVTTASDPLVQDDTQPSMDAPRRSERIRDPPRYLQDYICKTERGKM
ncbi:hypothetical protein GE061_004758 [Apolygus lucorum]|uniref:Uncharacterized protein n=1 Tax=Apolygus lucorum TaxID=248454 RepID=A0A8S9X1L6_APOLU|nr:hypothetical protein GE061_004758 [Apolygus lucorum]